MPHTDKCFLLVLSILLLTVPALKAENPKKGYGGSPAQFAGIDSTESYCQRHDFKRGGEFALRKARDLFERQQHDSSSFFQENAIRIFREHALDSNLAMAYVEKSIVQGKQGNPSLSVILLDSAANLLTRIPEGEPHMHVYWRKGIGLLSIGKYDEALDCCHKAALLAENLSKWDILIQINICRGNIYFETKNNEEAVSYYNKALDLSLKTRNNRFTAICYTCIANTINYDSVQYAISLYKKTLALDKINKHDYGLQATCNNIAAMYLFEGKYDSALIYLDEAIKYAVKNHDYSAELTAYGNAATAWAHKKEDEKCRIQLSRALEVARKVDTPRCWGLYFYVLSETDKARGDFENAFKNYQEYNSIEDSLLQEKNRLRILEVETLYKTQQVKNENLKLTARNAQVEMEAIKNRNLRNFFGLVTISLLIVTGLIGAYVRTIRRSREKVQSQLKIIQQKNEQIELLMKDIHHSVKNNLGTIQSILNLQKNALNNKTSTAFIDDIQSRINTIAELHRHLYLGDDLKNIELKRYFSDITKMSFELFPQMEGLVIPEIHMEVIHIAKEQGLMLGMMVSEMIMNSLKYAFPDNRKGFVRIEMRTEGNSAVLEVSDDGTGTRTEMDRAGRESGLGIRLIHLLAKNLHGNLSIEGETGTKYTFELPIPEQNFYRSPAL